MLNYEESRERIAKQKPRTHKQIFKGYRCARWLVKIYEAFEYKADKYYSKADRAPGKLNKYEIARLVYYHSVYFSHFDGTGRDELRGLGFIDREIDNCYTLMRAYFEGYDPRLWCMHVDWHEPTCWIVPVHNMFIDKQARLNGNQDVEYINDQAIRKRNRFIWTDTCALPDWIDL